MSADEDDASVGLDSVCDALSIAEGDMRSRPRSQPDALDEHRFRMVHTIGSGAMGRVELVHDRRLLRDVAWKRGDARLLREARVLAQLEHPGIVPVHDMGFGPDGEAYFAMRVVRGRSLAERLHDADGDARTTLARALQRAAEAVAYAHHRGVVHRDLKPANVMIGDFGEAQVVDWGLAAILPDAADPIPDGARLALAGFETGRVGTPGYMSPEQELGLAADRRSDVFGLGRILERIFVSGSPAARSGRRRPNERSTDATSGDVAPARGEARTRPGELPPELVAIIARATAVSPKGRYPDAREFAIDLGRFLDGHRVAAYTYRPGELLRRFVSAYRTPLAIALSGLVLAVSLIALYVVDVGRERNVAESAEAATRVALERSDRMLARALVGEARRSAEGGARPEAEVLAAHALRLAEDPDARGILSALGAPSATLVQRTRSPCVVSEADPAQERLLCVEGDGVSLYVLGAEAPPMWTRKLPVQLARLAAHGVVVSSAKEIVVFDLEGRETVREKSPINVTRKTSVEGDRVVFESGRVSAMVSVVRREILPLLGCRGELHSALVVGDGTLEASICKDGSLLLFDTHQPGLTLPEAVASGLYVPEALEPSVLGVPVQTPFKAPEREAVRAARFGDRFVVGTIKGEVAVVDLSGHVVTSSSVVSGMVRILAVSPDDRFAAVAGDGDTIQIVTLPELARVTALPRRAHGVSWDTQRPGELVTTGAFIERWRMEAPDDRRPLGGVHAVELRDGVVSLEVDPTRNDGLAIAFGALGGVVDREHLQWTTTGLVTAKAATFGPEGVLTVAGIQGGSRYDVAALGFIEPFPWVTIRRAVTLADGAAIVAGYASVGRIVGSHLDTLDTREAYDLSASPGRGFAVYVRQADRMLVRVKAGDPVPEDIAIDLFTEAVAIGADGERIYSAHAEEVAVWNALGYLEGLHRAGGVELTKVAVSADGRFVAAGARVGHVLVWRSGEVEPVARYSDHDERVPALAFSNDSRWLASGSWDRHLRIRDLQVLEEAPEAISTRLGRRYGMDLDEALGRRLGEALRPRRLGPDVTEMADDTRDPEHP